jgi:hypothetical protein
MIPKRGSFNLKFMLPTEFFGFKRILDFTVPRPFVVWFAPMSEPKSALIVKEKWALKLLNGEKTWEIRGSSTSKRGKIAIAISGTGKLFGEITLVDAKLVGYRLPDGRLVKGDVADADFIENNFEHHQIEPEEMQLVNYRKVWAWIMADPVKYIPPRTYTHQQGCVIWNPLGETKSKPKVSVTAVKKRPSVKK